MLQSVSAMCNHWWPENVVIEWQSIVNHPVGAGRWQIWVWMVDHTTAIIWSKGVPDNSICMCQLSGKWPAVQWSGVVPCSQCVLCRTVFISLIRLYLMIPVWYLLWLTVEWLMMERVRICIGRKWVAGQAMTIPEIIGCGAGIFTVLTIRSLCRGMIM